VLTARLSGVLLLLAGLAILLMALLDMHHGITAVAGLVGLGLGCFALAAGASLSARGSRLPFAWHRAVPAFTALLVTVAVLVSGEDADFLLPLYVLVVLAASASLPVVDVLALCVWITGLYGVLEITGPDAFQGLAWIVLTVTIVGAACLVLSARDQYTDLLEKEQAESVELRRSNELREQMVEVASHELRNPLTAMLTMLETMADNPWADDTTRRRFILIKRNGARVARAVEEMSMLSQSHFGEFALRLDATDLFEAASETVASLTPLARELGVTLRVEQLESGVVLADRQRILQLLDNLVHNALKYTRPGGIVVVRVDGRAIEVEDTGIGIATADLERIFERGVRVEEPVTPGLGGSGLGLAVCKEIADAHGFLLEVTSRVGEGSTFRLSFPAEELTPVHDVERHDARPVEPHAAESEDLAAIGAAAAPRSLPS